MTCNLKTKHWNKHFLHMWDKAKNSNIDMMDGKSAFSSQGSIS